MLISENFLPILFQANHTFSKITGQLFTYNAESQKVHLLNQNEASRNGYKFRWILMIFVACATLARIAFIKLKATEANSKEIVELNLCVMMICMLLVVAECYKMWTYYPEDLVLFLNGAIDMEIHKSKGEKKQSYLLQYAKCFMQLFSLQYSILKYPRNLRWLNSFAKIPTLPVNGSFLLE